MVQKQEHQAVIIWYWCKMLCPVRRCFCVLQLSNKTQETGTAAGTATMRPVTEGWLMEYFVYEPFLTWSGLGVIIAIGIVIYFIADWSHKKDKI